MEEDVISTATIGYCELECSNFWVYMILFSVFVFIHSTSEVGSMLLILRCVDPRDKAMALGLIQFAIGLFGNYFTVSLFNYNSNVKRDVIWDVNKNGKTNVNECQFAKF